MTSELNSKTVPVIRAIKKGFQILKGELPGQIKYLKPSKQSVIEKYSEVTFQQDNIKYKATYYKMKGEPNWIFDSMITKGTKRRT